MTASEGRAVARSATVKIVLVGLLGLLLFIPLAFVWGLISERTSRRDEVTREISQVWGGRQTVGGVALVVPFDVESRLSDTTNAIVARTAVLLPDAATIEATLTPEVRYRSLFPVIVYRSTLRLSGRFAAADLFAGLRVTPTAVHWDRARVIVSLSDMRGAVAVSPLTFGGRDQPLEPATEAASPFRGALQAPVIVDPEAVTPFAVEMTLAGTGALRFLPIGKATEVRLQSPWRHPGFAGAFLPESRTVTDAGFDARWRVTYLARSVPHAWVYEAATRDERRQQLDATEFGVDLVQPVDQYQQTWRATKYGLLFILLTFAVVLLWEVRHALSLHPLQYLMVGCALVVFYLLLLSLSEHVGFAWAYGLAATATVGLVTAYAARILASGLRGGGVMAGWLGTLYGFLYTLLQLEDLALLLGSIAVFLMLAALMYFTRRIDWYTMSTSQDVQA